MRDQEMEANVTSSSIGSGFFRLFFYPFKSLMVLIYFLSLLLGEEIRLFNEKNIIIVS